MTTHPERIALVDLIPGDRGRADPLLHEAFTGMYRWHAKRTLGEVSTVRGAETAGELVGVSLLERLAPEAGYVYYVAVALAHRRKGIGALLLDDALERFRSDGVRVVYAAVQSDNLPSRGLFGSRGFRDVGDDEPGFLEGGLAPTGLRTRMRVVYGERLLGLRFPGPP